jgi:hypothetical protein
MDVSMMKKIFISYSRLCLTAVSNKLKRRENSQKNRQQPSLDRSVWDLNACMRSISFTGTSNLKISSSTTKSSKLEILAVQFTIVI